VALYGEDFLGLYRVAWVRCIWVEIHGIWLFMKHKRCSEYLSTANNCWTGGIIYIKTHVDAIVDALIN
jgi:hypothetical protein